MSTAQVSAHLRKFSPAQRGLLTALRDLIASELPAAEQVIKYGIPTFVIEGVPVIGFDGYKNHNSLFPYSGSINAQFENELRDYVQTKGSIHFDLGKAFPKQLLKKILKEKITQINSQYPKTNGEYLVFYPNGVLKARGKYKAGKLHGEWEWFRKTGVIMRSGSFKNGTQTGTWVTYDVKGKLYKKTQFSQ
ncbi:unannotated protein [freshwater metagenome]|uniref:Unannotated protein n=1 Tax=freshwater metagenome TaxID=449393 RepID=A0A6J6QSB2_9ZZZZ|nr:hypothetical protein [Actinomycetota bacterium]MSX90003.1 hypothetical protein [Actinomycetota bacterium]MSZ64088.1 hypothetical protein [Actinomycetota bacterium]MTA58063.1 hypothetical protein [Actinomycetota bacterium]